MNYDKKNSSSGWTSWSWIMALPKNVLVPVKLVLTVCVRMCEHAPKMPQPANPGAVFLHACCCSFLVRSFMSLTLPRTIAGSNASGSHFLGKEQQCENAPDITSTPCLSLQQHGRSSRIICWPGLYKMFLDFKYLLVFLYKFFFLNIYSRLY